MTCRFQAHSFRFLVQVLGPFIFNIISPGGGECARVTQSVVCLPGTNTRHSEYRLGSSTVSIEKWLYPERVYKEEIAREEILGLEKVDNLKLEHHDDCIGQCVLSIESLLQPKLLRGGLPKVSLLLFHNRDLTSDVR